MTLFTVTRVCSTQELNLARRQLTVFRIIEIYFTVDSVILLVEKKEDRNFDAQVLKEKRKVTKYRNSVTVVASSL
jgi:hypothetical protein